MNPFFLEPEAERLPPEQTRIIELRAEPYPDGYRLRVGLDMTPFQKRPNIELELTAPDGGPAASASVIEPMNWKLELTLHLARGTSRLEAGTYALTAALSYPDLGEVDRREVFISLPPP